LEDGIYTCTATVTGTDIQDEETIIVDSSGPQITIFTPERGSWTMDESVEVTGFAEDAVAGLDWVTINDESVEILADGEFDYTADLSFGINTIETIAADMDYDEDGVGNESNDVRSVLHAPSFLPTTESLLNGILLRIEDDAGGIGQIEQMAEAEIASLDLSAEISGEIFDVYECVIPNPFGSGCWMSVSATGYVDGLSYSSASLDIDPRGSGIIEATLTLDNVHVDWHASTSVGTVTGDIDATSVWVDMVIDPYVSALGYLLFSIDDVNVGMAGFTFEASGPWDEIADLVIDVEAEVRERIEDAVVDAVFDTVPDLLDDTLGDLRVEQSFDLAGNTYDLFALAQALEVDESGMTIHLKTKVSPDEELGGGASTGPTGSPKYGFTAPSWVSAAPPFGSTASGTNLAISTDFLNQTLFAFWRGGVMDQELTDEDLDLDMSTIGLLMPGLTEMTLVTIPLLPPVAVPRSDWSEGAEYDLQIGDMLVRIHNGEVATDTLYMELYVSVVAPMSLAAGADGDSISLELGDPEVLVDVTYTSDGYAITTESTETLFEDLMPLYLPEITGAIGEVPLPSIEGLTLSSVTTSMAGGDLPPGYWVLSGDLE
jgi:hypothetical protein